MYVLPDNVFNSGCTTTLDGSPDVPSSTFRRFPGREDPLDKF